MPASPSSRHRLALWLFCCAALVWATLVVGGITRLTHSGLSIAVWQPLIGIVPPLDDAAWQAEFARYQGTPEYRLVNAGMPLDGFKAIFWWEYVHRLLGRLDGLAFGLPLAFFWVRRRIDLDVVRRLSVIFALGAAQGALGWYMVKSGLVDDPRVSQYRLAAHLALAFAIFGALLWSALDMIAPRLQGPASPALDLLRRQGLWLLGLVFVMVVSGAFVAGIHAGKAYNTFPLMAGHWLPPEILMLDPWYANFFNNPAAVQFDHRLGAWLLAGLLPWFAWRVRAACGAPRVRLVAMLMVAALTLQISLGIATLLNAVPVALGATHQAGAMLLFGMLIWLNHELRTAYSTASPGQ